MIVAVIGLGYVGLPLVLAFGRHVRTIGYDLAEDKVQACQQGQDPSHDIPQASMLAAHLAEYTSDPAALAAADFIIVAVPTPVTQAHVPDFAPLISASKVIGRYIKAGATVIFESTVFPGATEEICIPAIEQAAGKQWQRDFFVGYSPERINPGDREHVLEKVIKVVSADCPATLEKVAALYSMIVEPGVYRCSSIKVAEASKVIENTQRDLNIALMNELAMICHRVGIDTSEVLQASGTKWNFLPFKPGLVGGHCVGVDPYYLTYKADTLGYHSQVILAGRRINDSMGKYVAEQTVKRIIHTGRSVKGARVLVLGLTFKEDCADIRNSKVVDIVQELHDFGVETYVHDPIADPQQAWEEYRIRLHDWHALPQADAMIIAVAHQAFRQQSLAELTGKLQPGAAFIDVKSMFDRTALTALGFEVWRL